MKNEMIEKFVNDCLTAIKESARQGHKSSVDWAVQPVPSKYAWWMTPADVLPKFEQLGIKATVDTEWYEGARVMLDF